MPRHGSACSLLVIYLLKSSRLLVTDPEVLDAMD